MTSRHLGTGFESLDPHARRGLRRLLAGLSYAADLLAAPWYRLPALAVGPSTMRSRRAALRQRLTNLIARGRKALTGSRSARGRGNPNQMYLDALEQRQLYSVFQISGTHNPSNADDFQLALSTDSASIQSWTVNWNDGSAPQTLTGNTPQTDHVYANATDPTITVTAVDNDGTHVLSLIPASSSSLTATPGQYAFQINTDANGTAFLGNTVVTDPTLIGAALTWTQQQVPTDGSGAYQQYNTVITIPTQGEDAFVLSPVPQAASSGGGGIMMSGGHFADASGMDDSNGYGGAAGVTRELWVGQASVNNPNWDNVSSLGTPTYVDTTADFSSHLGYGESAIIDMSAYLTPPESGYYTFTINSDYGGDLYVSTNSSPDNEQLIASFSGQGSPLAGQAQSHGVYLNAGSTYYIEAVQEDFGRNDPISVGWSDTAYGGSINQQPISGDYLTTTQATPGGITCQVWSGQATTNSNLNDLSNLGGPSEVVYPTNFDAQDAYGGNIGNAIIEMSGVLTVPESRDYSFTVTGDYGAQLYLSTDSTAANKQLIASFSGQSTSGYQVNSGMIYLTAGQSYYIESVQEDFGNGDPMYVGWQDVSYGGSINQQPISGSWFGYGGSGGSYSGSTVDTPQNFSAAADGADGMTLTWNGDFSASSYELTRQGPNGATVTIGTGVGYDNGDGGFTYVDKGLTPGTSYSYSLTACNPAGDTSSTVTASGTTQNLSVSITSSNSVYEGGTKTLIATSNAYFGNVTYKWDLDQSNNYGLTNDTRGNELGASVTFSAAGLAYPGNYTVKVEAVEDGITSSTVSQTLSLLHVSPLLTISGPAVVGANNPYVLNLSGTDLGSGTITSWTINWGDGSSLTLTGNPTSATHSYASAASNLSITATASDNYGTYQAKIAATADTSLLVAGDQGVYSVMADQADPGARSTISLDGNTVRVENTNYTSNIVIGLNGILYIGSSGGPSVYPLWRDWVSTGFDSAVLYSFEDNGNELCVQWTNVQPQAGGTPATFQAIIPLNTGTQNAMPTLNYLSVPGMDFAVTSYTWGTGEAGSSFDGTLPNSDQIWSVGTISSLTLSAANPLRLQVNATTSGLSVSTPTVSGNSSTSAFLSVPATDALGGTDLTYTWSVADDAPAPVVFSDNGDNTAARTLATFSASGTYHLFVTVSSASGASVTEAATYYIGSSLDTVQLTPLQPAPAANGTQGFTATLCDINGIPLAVQPPQSAYEWSVSGSGYSISDGVLQAGNSVGSYSVGAWAPGADSTTYLPFNSTPEVLHGASQTTSTTSAALSVLGTDALGGTDLTYTWSVTSGDAAAVSFEDNGDNSAATTTADFTSAGNYTFQVTLSNGNQTASSSVSLTVNQVQTSVQVTPLTAVPTSINGTQTFAAFSYDQFGYAINPNNWSYLGLNNFSWEVDNPAFTITGNGSAGTLTAGATGASYNVLAALNGMLSNIVPENQAISITTQPTASLNSTTHNATATLSVAATDTAGIASYNWTVSNNAPGSVSFSDNDDTTANSVTATFSSAGTYQFVVTITDNNGLVTTASKTLNVGQSLTSITANSTASAPTTGGGTQLFTATAYDQFGVPLNNQPTFNWSETGSGYSFTNATTGVLTASATSASYDVVASYSGISSAPVYFSPTTSIAIGASAIIDSSSTSANLSVTAADVNGGTDLTYTWTVSVGDASQVSFEDNDDNSAADTTVDFASAGSYTFLVTASNGAQTATSSVNVTVSQVLTTIVAEPATFSNTNLYLSGSQYVQQFTACGFDQFGDVMAAQPSSFNWSVAGNGNAYTIGSTSGLLTTEATAGNYIVTASAGSVTSEPLQFSEYITVSSMETPSATLNDGTTSTYLGISVSDSSSTDLTYTWSTTDNSPGGVTYSSNGSESSSYTTATFSAAGTYQFIVTITDANGDTSTALTAPITITPQLTSVQVTPATPLTNGTQQFMATAYDQFGYAMPTQPTFSWTVNGVSSHTVNSSTTLLTIQAPSSNYTVSASVNVSGYTTSGTLTPTSAISILAAASATVDTTSYAFATLSVLGTDSTEGEDLRYKWTVTSGIANNVIFSNNGGHSADNTTALFTAPGTYQFSVTVSDRSGHVVSSTTSSVVVTDVLSSIVVSTNDPVPLAGGSQQFNAVAYDQFGLRLATQPPFNWTATGSNYSINSTGDVSLANTGNNLPTSYIVDASATQNVGGTIITVAGSMPQDALAPVVVAAPEITGTTNTTVNLSVLGADMFGSYGNQQLYYSWYASDNSPDFVSFTNNDSQGGTVTVATFHSVGNYDLCVDISNDLGMYVTADVTYTVTAVPTSIQTTANNSLIPINSTASFTATVEDQFHHPMSGTITWSLNGYPAGTTTIVGAGTQSIVTAGSMSGTITVQATTPGQYSNLNATASTETYQTTDTPVLHNFSFTATENGTTTLSAYNNIIPLITSTDTGIDPDPYIEITQQPADGIVTLDGHGDAVYTPDEDFVGNDSFVYRITNSDGATASATVTLTVVPSEPEPANEYLTPGTRMPIADGAYVDVNLNDYFTNTHDVVYTTEYVPEGMSVTISGSNAVFQINDTSQMGYWYVGITATNEPDGATLTLSIPIESALSAPGDPDSISGILTGSSNTVLSGQMAYWEMPDGNVFSINNTSSASVSATLDATSDSLTLNNVSSGEIAVTCYEENLQVNWVGASSSNTLGLAAYDYADDIDFPAGTVAVLGYGDWLGSITALNVTGTIASKMEGSIFATDNITNLSIGSNVPGDGDFASMGAGGSISNVIIQGDFTGNMSASGDISALTINGDLQGSMTSSQGAVTAVVADSISGGIQAATGINVQAGTYGYWQLPMYVYNWYEGSWCSDSNNDVSATMNGTFSSSAGSVTLWAPYNISGTISDGAGEISVTSEVGNIAGVIASNYDQQGEDQGTITLVQAGANINATISAYYGSISAIYAGGDITGTITAQGGAGADDGSGVIGTINATGNISAVISAVNGIGTVGGGSGYWYSQNGSSSPNGNGVHAGGDITGNISSTTGDICVYAGDDVTGNICGGPGDPVVVIAYDDINGNVSGDVIDQVSAGWDITGNITAQQNIGTITAGNAITGNITAGAAYSSGSTGALASGWIGTITAGADPNGNLWDDSTGGSIGPNTITANGSIGSIGVLAAINYSGAISGATINSGGDIGCIYAATGINATVTANGSIGTYGWQYGMEPIDPGTGNLAGSFTAKNGSLPDINCPDGSITANLTAGTTIGNLTASQNISGNILATDGIASVTALIGNISGNITATNATAGSIGNVFAGNNLSGNLSAQTYIGDVMVFGTMSGYLFTHSGSMGGVIVFGDITSTGYIAAGNGNVEVLTHSEAGSISGTANITVIAHGTVSGDISTTAGAILVKADGSITNNKTFATLNILLRAGGNIKTNATSSQGGVVEDAWGTITSNVQAKTAADLAALTIDSSNAKAAVVDYSAYTINASNLTGSVDALASATTIDGSNIDGNPMVVPVCFAAGTLVTLADGGMMAIERIREDADVVGVLESDPTGKPMVCKVEKVFHNRPARIWHVHVAGHVLRCTALHPFYVKGKGWIHAKDLLTGDPLLSNTGETLAVQKVEDSGVDEPVFNLQVRQAHTYYVALEDNGPAVLVHNDSGGAPATPTSTPTPPLYGPPTPPGLQRKTTTSSYPKYDPQTHTVQLFDPQKEFQAKLSLAIMEAKSEARRQSDAEWDEIVREEQWHRVADPIARKDGRIKLLNAAGGTVLTILLAVAPEPTLLTKAGAAAAGTYSLDQARTGLWEIFSGAQHETIGQGALRQTVQSPAFVFVVSHLPTQEEADSFSISLMPAGPEVPLVGDAAAELRLLGEEAEVVEVVVPIRESASFGQSYATTSEWQALLSSRYGATTLVGPETVLEIPSNELTSLDRLRILLKYNQANRLLGSGEVTALKGSNIKYSSFASQRYARDIFYPLRPIQSGLIPDGWQVDEYISRQFGGPQAQWNQHLLEDYLNQKLGPIEFNATKNLPPGTRIYKFYVEFIP